METVTAWTGESACTLQAALRLSNEAFAAHLGIGVRTVAAWHQKPALRPRPEMQQLRHGSRPGSPGGQGPVRRAGRRARPEHSAAGRYRDKR